MQEFYIFSHQKLYFCLHFTQFHLKLSEMTNKMLNNKLINWALKSYLKISRCNVSTNVIIKAFRKCLVNVLLKKAPEVMICLE